VLKGAVLIEMGGKELVHHFDAVGGDGDLVLHILASGEGEEFLGAEGGGEQALAQALQGFLTTGRRLGGLLENHASLHIDTELHLAVGQQTAPATDRQGNRDLAHARDPHGRRPAAGGAEVQPAASAA
jgi:hypothetical protein